MLQLLLVGATLAQATPTPTTKRSLAEGMTRQWIELHKFVPLHLESGLELGAGQGPLTLLARRADGTFELVEIERGAGAHGQAIEKQVAQLEVLEQEAEEEIPGPEKPKAAAPKAAEPKAVEPNKPAAKPTGQSTPTLQLRKNESGVRLESADGSLLSRGARLDRAVVQTHLAQLFANSRGLRFASQLLQEVEPQVPMQDVLTLLELARSTGFTLILFSNRQGMAPLPPAARELLSTLPAKQGWAARPNRPGNARPFCDGELLILLEDSARWADFAPLYVQCASAGIWQVSLVGQKDARSRFKVPINLPFDAGR